MQKYSPQSHVGFQPYQFHVTPIAISAIRKLKRYAPPVSSQYNLLTYQFIKGKACEIEDISDDNERLERASIIMISSDEGVEHNTFLCDCKDIPKAGKFN